MTLNSRIILMLGLHKLNLKQDKFLTYLKDKDYFFSDGKPIKYSSLLLDSKVLKLFVPGILQT